jgi:integrase
MPLTDIKIRNAKPRDRDYKLYDGSGLYVLVHKNGSRYWRLKYSYAEKEKILALGIYPDIRLNEARERAQEARELVKQGIDPNTHKRETKARNIALAMETFQVVADEWLTKNEAKWSASYSEKVRTSLAANVLPRIGKIPISTLTAPMIIDAIRPMEARGAIELASRAMRWAKAIMRYAVVTGRIDRSPLSDIRAAEVFTQRTAKRHPHLERGDIGDFLRRLVEYPGKPETRIAVNLLMLTAVRTGELRAAKWEEIDMERGEWRIPAERMKMRAPHIVPLSSRVLELLKELHDFTGYSPYLFPGGRGRFPYMSENTVNKAIAMLGYKGKVVGHGFRATFSTITNESGHFSPDVIERQLAHKDRNEVRAAYNRSEYLMDRRKMMQWWADYLDQLKAGATVIPLHESA